MARRRKRLNVRRRLRSGLCRQWIVRQSNMLKRVKTRYRYEDQPYTAKGLYRKFRNQMTKIQGKFFHAWTTTVEYNLSDDPKQPEWIQVRPVFNRMKSAPESSWVVLLCTELGMDLPEVWKRRLVFAGQEE